MNISLNTDLNDEQITELSQIIGCDSAHLASKLSSYCKASLTEYTSMILGQKVFRRGSDIQEFRLYLLICEVFDNKIPDEQTVSRLFQTTASQSRSLIRSVMSKYQYQLRDAIEESLKQIISNLSAPNDGVRSVVINCTNLVEELNRIIAEIDGSLPPIKKQRGSVSTHEVENSTYNRLCQKFNLSPN